MKLRHDNPTAQFIRDVYQVFKISKKAAGRVADPLGYAYKEKADKVRDADKNESNRAHEYAMLLEHLRQKNASPKECEAAISRFHEGKKQ